MQLELQKYLQTHSPEQLKEEYFISYKPSEKYPNLYLFKYDQIHSPMEQKICQEARGIILDANNSWKVVSMGFTKFFNLGETKAAKLDWNTAKIYTKQDGSLICLYRYNNEWLVSTTGHPDAGGNVNDFGFTFSELFWRVFREKKYKLPSELEVVGGHLRYTYMFELETPFNRIVVDHQANNLTFLGARNLDNLREVDPSAMAAYYGWDCVKEWEELKTEQDVAEILPEIKPLEQEGFVVVDGNFQRLKIKSPEYIKLHHCLEGLSKKRMIDVILTGEVDECRPLFKQFGDMFEDILFAFDELKKDIQKEYDLYKGIENQKEFALAIKDSKNKSVLFVMRNKKIDAEVVLKTLSVDLLLNLLDVYLPESKKEESNA